MSTKRTFFPHKIKRARQFGFRAKSKNKKGLLVLKRRSLKGRKRLIP
jgi:ribosomal protein L34